MLRLRHAEGAGRLHRYGLNVLAVCFCDTWEVYKVGVYARVRRAVQVSATPGKGWSLVKVSTTNGGVRLNRAGV